ncbi:unnamed protein product, partial [Brassica oleracea var. botrytis]
CICFLEGSGGSALGNNGTRRQPRSPRVIFARMRTKALMVFKLDDEGNAVYTQDMGDLVMFLSNSEPCCVPATSFPGLYPNYVEINDFDELAFV